MGGVRYAPEAVEDGSRNIHTPRYNGAVSSLVPTSPQPVSVVVVVVNFNGGALLSQCLGSLSRQLFRDFRIVVVDNASTDGSADDLEKSFPDVSVIRSQTNLGFAAGNNLAIREAGEAPFIALLNPDAIAQQDWLYCLMKAAQEHHEFALFGSRMYADARHTILDGVGDAYHVSGLPWRVGHGQQAQGRYLEHHEIFAPCAAAALYRKEVFKVTGGFDEDFFCYVEDVDLGFRARLAGMRALYVADAVVEHAGSGIVGKHSDFQLYHGHRNLVWAYVRNMPLSLLLVYLPLHILLTLVTLAAFGARGRGRILLRAKFDALKGLPRSLAKRRKTQSLQVVSAAQIRAVLQRGLPRRFRQSGWE